MADWLSQEQRSRNMASIRSKGNATTERTFLTLLREAGISGWRRHADLPGKPDFSFAKHRLAVFVDGCFWHGCPRCYRAPEDNRSYWRNKVRSNRLRDRRNARKLRTRGWSVVRFWEHALRKEKERNQVLLRLKQAVCGSAAYKDKRQKNVGGR